MENPKISYYKKILVPFEGSEGASKALRRALLLAKDEGAEVTVFSVDEHLPRFAPGLGEVDEENELRDSHFGDLRARAEAVATAQGGEVKIETAIGHAAQLIVRAVHDQGFDLIVIGHSGHSAVWGTLLGSTTVRVVDHAPCDVLVVR